MTQPATPSPQLFFETAFAFQRSAAIKAATDLAVFTAISEDHHTSTSIASHCQGPGS